jgi:hypothetical protein
MSNAGATVTVAKGSGPGHADAAWPQNLAKMISRLPTRLASPSPSGSSTTTSCPALFTLTLGHYPIYLPTGVNPLVGIQVSPYGIACSVAR